MRLSGVWFRYARRDPWVLSDVSVKIEPGEIVVVQGHNGAGKSTLLQLAAGVLHPVKGRVTDRPHWVGWVPEHFPAEQPFTVDRYLRAMAAVAGLPETEASSAVQIWSHRLGLVQFRQTRLAELSKGTAQKVGLAQALLVAPDLLILDEPWEGLDAATRDQVPEIVNEVVHRGGSVFVSDHRGETARLPGATQWTVEEATVTAQTPEGVAPWIIEIEVPAADGPATLSKLKADGHDVVRVKDQRAARHAAEAEEPA
ncbi:MAG: ABC transporter ATP-binding protein [Micromonosporaceae bacterium]|nr:ABC transporter ATP-binding protein [Micromonosporaceae bacterium]